MPPTTLLVRTAISTALAFGLHAPSVAGQDMEPKAYSASPVGANFLVAAYSGSNGSVVFDPTLPVTDVEAHVRGFALGAGHTFSLFRKLALLSAAFPFAWADVSGKVQEQAASVNRTGFSDARIKLSVNFKGNDAMSPREFATARRRTVVGASLTVSAPIGQYYPTKLINLGTNRWAYKPEIGISFPKARWDLDMYAGAWFFNDNDSFFPGTAHRSQSPVFGLQGHASYTFRRGLWAAADGTWYSGGSVRLNNGDPSSSMNNTRLGLTVSFPVGARNSVKVAYGTGAIVRTGTDFRTVAVAWQSLWLSPRWSGR